MRRLICTTKLSSLPADLYGCTLKREAKETNYSQDVLHMTYDDIESIPCITERESRQW